jgi:hypothetical protein
VGQWLILESRSRKQEPGVGGNCELAEVLREEREAQAGEQGW